MAGSTWETPSSAYLAPRSGQSDAWTAEDPGRHSQRILEVATIDAPPQIAEALRLQPGEQVVVRRRLMLVDDRPVELTDTYYPARIAAGTALAKQNKIRGGAITALAQLGHIIATVVEDVTAGRIDNPEQYGLTSTDPVLILTRVSLDDDDQPIEASVMHMLDGQHLTYRTRAA